MVDTHTGVRFEKTDIRIGPVVGFLAILSTVMAGIMGLLWATQSWIIASQRANMESEHPLAAERAMQDESLKRPPAPQIEGVGLDEATHSVTNPNLPTSARSQRQREEDTLATKWTDAAGRVHPPIKDAMRRLIAEHKRKQEGK